MKIGEFDSVNDLSTLNTSRFFSGLRHSKLLLESILKCLF